MKNINNINFDSLKSHLNSDSPEDHCACKTGGTVNTDNSGESDKLSKRKRKSKPKKRGRKPKKQKAFKDYRYHYDFSTVLLSKLRNIEVGKLHLEDCPRSYELALKILYFVACKSPKSGWECIQGISVSRNYFKALGYGCTTITNVFNLLVNNRLLIVVREADRKAIGEDGQQGRCRTYSIPEIYRVNLKLPESINLYKKTEQEPVIEQEPMKPEPVNDDLEKIKAIIKKFNTPFYYERIRKIGINPTDEYTCSECENPLPAYMFSISKTNNLNSKCRVCWVIEPADSSYDEAKSITDDVLMRLGKKRRHSSKDFEKSSEERRMSA